MSQLTILFLASNPSDMIPLNLAEEVRQIEQGLLTAAYGNHFDLRSQWAMRTDDLLLALNRYRPAIVHFAGHGVQEGIYLQSEEVQGTAQLVAGAALQRLFGLFRDQIRLVVLNSCLSQVQAKALATEVECVVGMGDAVSDVAARIFARAFYRALAFNWTVKEAFDQGVVAVMAAALPDEAAPHLFARRDVYAGNVRLLADRWLQTDIATGNVIVGQAIQSATVALQPATAPRKQEIAALYRAVATTLSHAVTCFEQGTIPHGDCEKMRVFAEEIYQAIVDYVGPTKAEAVRARLHAAHDVEQALLDLNALQEDERRRRLAELQRAAGYLL